MRRPPPTTVGFEGGGRESHTKNVKKGLETGKCKAVDFSLDLPKVIQFGRDLDFTLVGLGTSYRTERL